MNAKKPAEVIRSTVASFAELRRLNAQEAERQLRIRRANADRAIPGAVTKHAVSAKALHIGPLSIPVVTISTVTVGHGIVGK